jgi:hypothetical protein
MEQTRGLGDSELSRFLHIKLEGFFKLSLPIITIFTSSITKQLFSQRIIVLCFCPQGKSGFEAAHRASGATGMLESDRQITHEEGQNLQKSVLKIILPPLILCCDIHYQFLYVSSKSDLVVCVHAVGRAII